MVSYVDRFAQYTGESLTIVRTLRQGRTGAMVFSRIERPEGGTPVRVDWRLDSRGDALKVVDVVVEGTSLGTTLRSDFGSIIRRHGGKVSGLIEVLRAKTARLQEAAGG